MPDVQPSLRFVALRRWTRWVGCLVCVCVAACGPSEQTKVAGRSGCRLAEQFELASFGTDAESLSHEQQRARQQFPSRVTGLASGLRYAKTAQVVDFMKETCPDSVNVSVEAVEYHVAAGGEVHPGLGEFVEVAGER